MLAVAARLAIHSLPSARRPRLVTTEHNVWSSHALVTRLLNATTWGLDDAHLVVSDDVRDSVWPPGRRRRAEVLIHGTVVERFRAARAHRSAVRERLGIDPSEVLVGTVANFRSQKAYPDLLRAARRVVDREPGVRFVAVGQGPQEAEVRALHAELGLGDRFLLLGYRDDVPEILAAGDVFVLASRYEGLPVAVMEALAAGLPVVATDVAGIRQVVRPGVEGLLVPPRRPERLADAILAVATDKDLRGRLAEAASRRAEEFDVRRSIARIEHMYHELAGS